MYVKMQKFLVLGVSKSGYAVARYLLENGAECYLYEQLQSDKITKSINALTELGGKLVKDQSVESVLDIIDVLVISPGMPINHEIAVKAKQKGKRIIGELEFGFLNFLPTNIAVTGTNGKTTTVYLIQAILKESGLKNALVGNVGIPITGELNSIEKQTVCITEVSSFQLESVHLFCPHIACILNIAPDHLERHYSMENYILLKKRIFQNQRESEYTVLNYDDQTVRELAPDTKAKVVYVSIKERVEGAYVYNESVYYKDELLMPISDLALQGEHNLYDSLFAIVCAKLLGVSNTAIVRALMNFKGVKHRIQLVAQKSGVKFYNDSKATNTASTISAIEAMKGNTVLILGGSEKGERYEKLFEKIKQGKIKHTVLTGASRFNMAQQANDMGVTEYSMIADFNLAVYIARKMAINGDNVLLSPACASYDCFSSYEERGDKFISIVEGLS